MKDQYENYDMVTGEYIDSYKEYNEHYEPYYGSVVTSGDWE